MLIKVVYYHSPLGQFYRKNRSSFNKPQDSLEGFIPYEREVVIATGSSDYVVYTFFFYHYSDIAEVRR